jgi:hypothetical protein
VLTALGESADPRREEHTKGDPGSTHDHDDQGHDDQVAH